MDPVKKWQGSPVLVRKDVLVMVYPMVGTVGNSLVVTVGICFWEM